MSYSINKIAKKTIAKKQKQSRSAQVNFGFWKMTFASSIIVFFFFSVAVSIGGIDLLFGNMDLDKSKIEKEGDSQNYLSASLYDAVPHELMGYEDDVTKTEDGLQNHQSFLDDGFLTFDTEAIYEITKIDQSLRKVELNLEKGHFWIHAPSDGSVEISVSPYLILMSQNSIIDIDVSEHEILISQIHRTSDISYVDSEDIFTMYPFYSMKLSRDDFVSFIMETWKGDTFDTWSIMMIQDEIKWIESNLAQSREVKFNKAGFVNKLKEWIPFLIVSDEEKARTSLPKIDEALSQLNLNYSDSNKELLRQISLDAAALGLGAKNIIFDYLVENYNLVKNSYPVPGNKEVKVNNIVGIKSVLADLMFKLSADQNFFWNNQKWSEVYFIEDLISDTVSDGALGVLIDYVDSIEEEAAQYGDSEQLVSQILYLENLFLANYDDLFVEHWSKLLELEYFMLEKYLTEEDSLDLAIKLFELKIRQVGELWSDNISKHEAGLIAESILGKTVISFNDENVYFDFFVKNEDMKEIVNNSELSKSTKKIPDSEKKDLKELSSYFEPIINSAYNYYLGKEDVVHTLSIEEEKVKETYENFMKNRDERKIKYVRPPSIRDVLIRLREFGLNLEKNSIQNIQSFVELYNPTKADIIIDNWYLTNSNNKDEIYLLKGLIESRQKEVFYLENLDLYLPREGGSLYLYNDKNELIQKIKYPNIPKGESYSMQMNGKYTWSQPTPNSANIQVNGFEKSEEEDINNNFNLENILVSEIYPHDLSRFEIIELNLDGLDSPLNTVFDYELNSFHSIKSDGIINKILVVLNLAEKIGFEKTDKYNPLTLIKLITLPEDLIENLPKLSFDYDLALPQVGVGVSSWIKNGWKELAFGSSAIELVYSDINQRILGFDSIFISDKIITDNIQSQSFLDDSFTVENFLLLPERIVALLETKPDYMQIDESFHPSAKPITDEINLKILQAKIQEDMYQHEIFIEKDTLIKDCSDVEKTIEDDQKFQKCAISLAKTYDPDSDTDLEFSFVYNPKKEEVRDVYFLKNNYFVNDNLDPVELRREILNSNKNLEEQEDRFKEISKELKEWEIDLASEDIEIKEDNEDEYFIREAKIKNPNKLEKREKPYLIFSANYNQKENILSEVEFEDGNQISEKLTSENFKEKINSLYSFSE